MPMSARHAIHASADCTNIMPTMAGEVTKRRNERARRGPRMSQMKPDIFWRETQNFCRANFC